MNIVSSNIVLTVERRGRKFERQVEPVDALGGFTGV